MDVFEHLCIGKVITVKKWFYYSTALYLSIDANEWTLTTRHSGYNFVERINILKSVTGLGRNWCFSEKNEVCIFHTGDHVINAQCTVKV